MTPQMAIRRVLRDLGLAYGRDFRVRQWKSRGKPAGIQVTVLTMTAEAKIAEHAEHIRAATFAAGQPFQVTVHWTRSQQPVTYVSHQ